jgi:hypothetical protein
MTIRGVAPATAALVRRQPQDPIDRRSGRSGYSQRSRSGQLPPPAGRGRSGRQRRKSARHAHAARDRRAPVRRQEDAHGRNYEDASQGRHRDGVVRPHLQSDTRLEHRRCARAARSDQGIGAGTPAPHFMREIRMSGSMSGERKRSVAAWPKQPRLSSTLPIGDQPTNSRRGRAHPKQRHASPETAVEKGLARPIEGRAARRIWEGERTWTWAPSV